MWFVMTVALVFFTVLSFAAISVVLSCIIASIKEFQ